MVHPAFVFLAVPADDLEAFLAGSAAMSLGVVSIDDGIGPIRCVECSNAEIGSGWTRILSRCLVADSSS
jgi:hypothetical protein